MVRKKTTKKQKTKKKKVNPKKKRKINTKHCVFCDSKCTIKKLFPDVRHGASGLWACTVCLEELNRLTNV